MTMTVGSNKDHKPIQWLSAGEMSLLLKDLSLGVKNEDEAVSALSSWFQGGNIDSTEE